MLPDNGLFLEIEAQLTVDLLDQIASEGAPAHVDLALPKFSVGSTMSLDLGATAMRDVADFSGIDGTKDLFISSTIPPCQVFLD